MQMKRIILAALVGVLVVGFLAIPAIAQGTLLFECDTKQFISIVSAVDQHFHEFK